MQGVFFPAPGILTACRKGVIDMKLSSFAWGLGVGMAAGVMLDMAATARPKARKTAVGKAMQRMGNAVDSAVDGVSHMMK